MAGRLPNLLALGLAFALAGCAPSSQISQTTGTDTVQGEPGEGFTNSHLRLALYEWPADNAPVKNVCLQNSLVIFTLLQQCKDPEKGGEKVGGELVYQGCSRNNQGRSASFTVHTPETDPWDVAVDFSDTAQQFSLAATSSLAR